MVHKGFKIISEHQEALIEHLRLMLRCSQLEFFSKLEFDVVIEPYLRKYDPKDV
jgi:hypothetical protein